MNLAILIDVENIFAIGDPSHSFRMTKPDVQYAPAIVILNGREESQ